MCLEAGPERRSSEAWAPGPGPPRPAPPRRRSRRSPIASATRGSSRTPTQCSEPSSSKRDHRQHRDLVRERTDRRDVVQRRHDRDGDGQQVGADHQRARDDADARAEGLARGRHPAPALRVAAGDLQVSERDEHEGDRGHQHEHRRQAADLGVEDRRDVVDGRPEVGEDDRPGERRAQVADAAAGGVVQFDFGCGGGRPGRLPPSMGAQLPPFAPSAQLDDGKQRIRHPKQPIRFLAGGNFEPPTPTETRFSLEGPTFVGKTADPQCSNDPETLSDTCPL